jgi:hypothetical protein
MIDVDLGRGKYAIVLVAIELIFLCWLLLERRYDSGWRLGLEIIGLGFFMYYFWESM